MKMKQLILLIAALFMTCAAMAQRPLVTLSHNGELSFFDSNSAFEEALDSAQNGDYIYLSEGIFTSKKTEIEINKRVSIVGSGYNSHIIPNIKIGITTPDSYMDAPLFDGVKLSQLSFSYDDNHISNLSKSEIKNSYLILTKVKGAGFDFLIDGCFIEDVDFDNSNTSMNVVVQNSKIYIARNTTYISFINCNIFNSQYIPKVLSSSIVTVFVATRYGSNIVPSINNCWLPADMGNVKSYNCYHDEELTLDNNLEPNIDLLEKGYLGTDGSVIGVYGGAIPYSESPSMPTVDSANSSVTFDKETNKLKVDIKVSTK